MSSRLVEPAHVALDLDASSRDGAVRAVAERLRGDARIGSFDAFRESIGPKQIVDLAGCGCGVCLAHGRESSVRELVLAAGRLPEGVAGALPRFVFLFAIPERMAEDYLRAVGALARACGEPARMEELHRAETPEALADALEKLLA